MKKFILIAIVLAASVVNAAEVKVLEAELPKLRGLYTDVDARFFMDTESHEGFVKVAVEEQIRDTYYPAPIPNCGPYGGCYPGPGGYHSPAPAWVTIFKDSVKVEGLELVGDKVMYHGVEGAVECGTLGTSRVLRRATIYLTGKCSLEGKVVGTATGHKVVVTLKTK